MLVAALKLIKIWTSLENISMFEDGKAMFIMAIFVMKLKAGHEKKYGTVFQIQIGVGDILMSISSISKPARMLSEYLEMNQKELFGFLMSISLEKRKLVRRGS